MKNKSGFSLIELLVVVAIIGILAAIGTVGYNKYINYAKDAVTKANLAQLTEALKVEDAKLGTCSTSDPIVCVNELATSANMKDPYVEQNLVVLNDSYAAPSQASYGDRNGVWGPQFMSIGLLVCQPAIDSNGIQFNPNTLNYAAIKHIALKATLSSGETIIQNLDFLNLHTTTYPGSGACDG